MEALSQSESSITEKHEWLTAGKQATGGNRLETEVDVRQEKRKEEGENERKGAIMYETGTVTDKPPSYSLPAAALPP